jgi:hypothetical protein
MRWRLQVHHPHRAPSTDPYREHPLDLSTVLIHDRAHRQGCSSSSFIAQGQGVVLAQIAYFVDPFPNQFRLESMFQIRSCIII